MRLDLHTSLIDKTTLSKSTFNSFFVYSLTPPAYLDSRKRVANSKFSTLKKLSISIKNINILMFQKILF